MLLQLRKEQGSSAQGCTALWCAQDMALEERAKRSAMREYASEQPSLQVMRRCQVHRPHAQHQHAQLHTLLYTCTTHAIRCR